MCSAIGRRLFKVKAVPSNDSGCAASAEITLPARSVTVSASVAGSTWTVTALVAKPSAAGATFTAAARIAGNTAQLASSGNVPPRAIRTRRISSVSAVTRITVSPRRTSIPSLRAAIVPCSAEATGAAAEAGAAHAIAAIITPPSSADLPNIIIPSFIAVTVYCGRCGLGSTRPHTNAARFSSPRAR